MLSSLNNLPTQTLTKNWMAAENASYTPYPVTPIFTFCHYRQKIRCHTHRIYKTTHTSLLQPTSLPSPGYFSVADPVFPAFVPVFFPSLAKLLWTVVGCQGKSLHPSLHFSISFPQFPFTKQLNPLGMFSLSLTHNLSMLLLLLYPSSFCFQLMHISAKCHASYIVNVSVCVWAHAHVLYVLASIKQLITVYILERMFLGYVLL